MKDFLDSLIPEHWSFVTEVFEDFLHRCVEYAFSVTVLGQFSSPLSSPVLLLWPRDLPVLPGSGPLTPRPGPEKGGERGEERGRTRSQDRRTGENGGDQAPGPENGEERGGTIGGAERDTQTYRDAPTESCL